MRTTNLLSTMAIVTTSVTAVIVQDVTKSEFTKQLKSNERILAAFTSRTVQKAQDFNTIFTSVAENKSTLFLTINCDKEEDLCREQDINAYPTIRYFSKSPDNAGMSVTRYRNPRTKQALQSFIQKRELPSLSLVEPADLEKFKSSDDVVVLAFLRPDQTKLLETFHAVGQRHHLDYVFGYSTDASSADSEKVSVPSIVLYKNADGDNKVLHGHFPAADVEMLLTSARETVIKTFAEKNVDEFMARDKLTTYIFLADITAAPSIRRALTPLAKKYEKYITFAIADVPKYVEMAQNFGVEVHGEGEGFPALVVHAPMNDHVFRYKQGARIDAGLVEEMLTTVLHGEAVDGQVFGGEEAVGHMEL